MDSVLMVSDMVWIQRGVAKEIPDKIKLTQDELKELIEGGGGAGAESTDNESDGEIEVEEEVEMKQVKQEKKVKQEKIEVKEVEMREEEEDDNDFEKKYLKGYDLDEDGEEAHGDNGMRGIAMYTNNKDDPYVTNNVDSDEEEEKDEIIVRKDDNMVAVAKIDKGDFTLECYVYNEADSDWYCHHDYILDAPPLCLEPIQHDPGNEETGKGNLVAVGTMNSEIHIWDLDIMNTVTPFITLGAPAKKTKSKRKKRDGSGQGHSDAVISLAWNRITSHVLASGGADKTVVLWDLDEAKPAQIIGDRGGEVQSIRWHPNESTFLLLGTMKGHVQVVDCRDILGQASAAWKFDGQIEKVLWNHFNPFTAFVTSDDGRLRYLDMRKPGQCIWEGIAHDGPIGGITLSALTRGLLVTVGEDEMMNIWKVSDTSSSIDKVHSEKLTIGELHCAQFNPDVGAVLSVGGTAADLIRVIDLTKYESVVTAFRN
ncbi:unnamed protein product [Caenorhabditis angaria]|uniref:Anaphase-promoting complex subunit 4 WD40 domain-containing protein n=1 Tax=Caenorhabditis angaria TaxID=860376 RepID=A0A9P1N2M1_9PELO|nr:unnamed protein product [Caenorhabditis angaria]